MKKVIVLIAIISLLLIGVVSAMPVVNPPSLWEKITHFLTSGKAFTIVGQDNHADATPRCVSGMVEVPYLFGCVFKVNAGTGFTKTISEARSYCNGKSAMWNVYAVSGINEYPRFESIDYLSFSCGSGNDFCAAELYCMPYIYPPTQSTCTSYASNAVLRIKNEVDPTMPLIDTNTNTPVTSYSYCDTTSSCTGEDKTCWRKISGSSSCESATYDCSYSTYSTIISSNCASGAGSYTFASESACVSSCVPSNICAASTCTGQTCTNNCGQIVQGTKTCTTTCTNGAIQSCTASNTCAGTQTCTNGVWGTCTKTDSNCGSTCSDLVGSEGSCTVLDEKKCSGTEVWICLDRGNNLKCWGVDEDCGDGTCNNGVCSGDNSVDTGSAKTITLTEYYSISDEDFVTYANGCGVDSDCSAVEGYTVTCVKEGTIYNQAQKRIFNYYSGECSDGVPTTIKWILGIGHWASIGVIPDINQVCSDITTARLTVTTWWNKWFESGTGICIAKSSVWYGKLWETALTMVGSFGIPANYVLMATVFALILIFVLLFQLIQGAIK